MTDTNLTSHDIWLCNARGTRIGMLDTVGPLVYSIAANIPGGFELTLPGIFDKVILPDDMIEIWRRPTGGRLKRERVYFVRRIRKFDDTDGADWISISGLDPLDLLRRRIVAYAAGSAQADMTDYIDDMLKAIVTDNLAGDATDTDRDLSALNLTVAPDLSACTSITRAFSYRKLDILFDELANHSRQLGTRLYYDFVPVLQSDDTNGFDFRTFTGQPGRDRTYDSGSPVIFGREYGNLAMGSLEYDYSEEENYIYAGGQGTEADRNIQEVEDTAREGASPWNRCEGFADARMSETDAAVVAQGRAALEEGRPRKTFDGILLDTPQARYGKDWEFGDLVTATYGGEQFDGVVSFVQVSVDENGQEQVEARLDIV